MVSNAAIRPRAVLGHLASQVHVHRRQHQLTPQRGRHRVGYIGARPHLSLNGGRAQVGGEDDLTHLQQRAVGQGFSGEHIKRGTGHFPRPDGLDQCILVHDAATRRVHDAHAVFHLGKGIGSDQTLGFRCPGEMDRDEIGHGKQLIGSRDQLHPDLAGTLRRDIWVVGHESHTERRSPLRDQRSDPAQTQDAECLVRQLDTDMARAIPVPLPHSRIGGGHPAGLRQHQGQRMFGRRNGVGLWCVDHQDSGGRGRIEIDVVHPDAGPAHDP